MDDFLGIFDRDRGRGIVHDDFEAGCFGRVAVVVGRFHDEGIGTVGSDGARIQVPVPAELGGNLNARFHVDQAGHDVPDAFVLRAAFLVAYGPDQISLPVADLEGPARHVAAVGDGKREDEIVDLAVRVRGNPARLRVADLYDGRLTVHEAQGHHRARPDGPDAFVQRPGGQAGRDFALRKRGCGILALLAGEGEVEGEAEGRNGRGRLAVQGFAQVESVRAGNGGDACDAGFQTYAARQVGEARRPEVGLDADGEILLPDQAEGYARGGREGGRRPSLAEAAERDGPAQVLHEGDVADIARYAEVQR